MNCLTFFLPVRRNRFSKYRKRQIHWTGKGFGFVEMAQDGDASSAISALNGFELNGRQLRVNEAENKPRRDRSGYSNRF